MRITREVSKVVKVTEDVLCDRCGKSLKGHIGNINGLRLQGSGSYDSTHFPDMHTFDADVCEACVVEWFKTFKRDPIQDFYNEQERLRLDSEED